MQTWKALIPTLVLGLGACESSGRPSGADVVAQAAGLEFTAQAAAEILAPQPQLPSQLEVVEALADLWVQYYLLARAAAQDTTLLNIDLRPLIQRQIEGELVFQLRERVIQVDTILSDDELEGGMKPNSRVAESGLDTSSSNSRKGPRGPRWTASVPWPVLSVPDSLAERTSRNWLASSVRTRKPGRTEETSDRSGRARCFHPSKLPPSPWKWGRSVTWLKPLSVFM